MCFTSSHNWVIIPKWKVNGTQRWLFCTYMVWRLWICAVHLCVVKNSKLIFCGHWQGNEYYNFISRVIYNNSVTRIIYWYMELILLLRGTLISQSREAGHSTLLVNLAVPFCRGYRCCKYRYVATVTSITNVTDVYLLLWLHEDARCLSLCGCFLSYIIRGFICLIC
jgi:hypothetical protein